MECRGFRPVHYLCRVYSGRIKQDCNAYGDRVPEQMNNGEWDGDFARDMLLSWYGKQGVQLDSNGDTTNGKDLDFSTDTVGKYVVRLTATSSESGSSKTDMLTILLDSGLVTPPRALTFSTDITAVFDAECIFCHEVGGSEPGIPVWWTTNQPSAAGMPVPSLYEQAMTRVIPRVIPEYIEDSLWLKKPSGQHHNGNRTSGLNTSVSAGAMERASYDMYVNWIAEGAVCGMVGPECSWTPDVGFKYA